MWLIHTTKTTGFNSEKEFPFGVQTVSWNNQLICYTFCRSVFEYFYVAEHQDIYELICEMSAYETSHRKFSDSVIIGGGIPIPDTSTTDVLKSLCLSIIFLDSWLKSLNVKYV